MFRKLIASALVAGTAVTGIAASSVADAGADKVSVCHSEGNGDYHLISISENAFAKHVEHGDGSPGEAVPGMEGFRFSEDCTPEVIPPTVTVTEGYSFLTEAAGVRFRADNSGAEVYLGTPDLGQAANRVQYDAVYSGGWGASNPVSFSWDGIDTITATALGQTLTYTVLAPACDPALWNTMDINVVDRSGVADELTFDNVVLDGDSLGDFGGAGWNNWTVSGFDFSQPFTLTGDINVVGSFSGSAETDKVQIVVGCTA